ncbi:MAG: DUF4012 domain-containing protein [Nocardioidaceae bacterium]
MLVGFTGYQALKAKTALEAVAADFDTLRGQLASGDEAGARKSLAAAQSHAQDARSNTRGPGWWVSARIPQIGPNVRAVRSVAVVADNLAAKVLPDVVSASSTLSPQRLKPVDGRIDLAPIRASAPSVERAASRLAVESDRVRGIDVASLAPQIAAPVQQLQTKIADAAGLADRASRAVRLLPDMLGDRGRRRYLFVFQNNAEIRATGGIPGSFALLTASNGELSLGRQDDSSTIASFPKPPTPITGPEKALFGEAMGRFFQDVNFTPDFPRSALLVSRMYQQRTGRTVDGVVSVDPIALSHVLVGTGPVQTVSGLTLTNDNVVQLLLSDVYADIPDTTQQNTFFNAVARDVFKAVSSGVGDPRAVLENIATSASERRLLLWSSRADEQKLLAPTAVAGRLETRATEAPQVGVYFNAAVPYKLDYYLDYEVSADSTRCVDGRQQLTVTADLSSRVPRNLRKLTQYVAPSVPQFKRGTIVTTLYFFAPVDGSVRTLRVDGEEQKPALQQLDGRPVFARTVIVKPGETTKVSVDVTAGRGQSGQPDLQVTPGVRSTGVGPVSASACS